MLVSINERQNMNQNTARKDKIWTKWHAFIIKIYILVNHFSPDFGAYSSFFVASNCNIVYIMRTNGKMIYSVTSISICAFLEHLMNFCTIISNGHETFTTLDEILQTVYESQDHLGEPQWRHMICHACFR